MSIGAVTPVIMIDQPIVQQPLRMPPPIAYDQARAIGDGPRPRAVDMPIHQPTGNRSLRSSSFSSSRREERPTWAH
jgi:hypothetical protein